jgi:hypothetical protein
MSETAGASEHGIDGEELASQARAPAGAANALRWRYGGQLAASQLLNGGPRHFHGVFAVIAHQRERLIDAERHRIERATMRAGHWRPVSYSCEGRNRSQSVTRPPTPLENYPHWAPEHGSTPRVASKG